MVSTGVRGKGAGTTPKAEYNDEEGLLGRHSMLRSTGFLRKIDLALKIRTGEKKGRGLLFAADFEAASFDGSMLSGGVHRGRGGSQGHVHGAASVNFHHDDSAACVEPGALRLKDEEPGIQS